MIIGKKDGQCNICGKTVRRLRVNQNSNSRIETGKGVVADYELKVLAQVLNTAVDDLLADESLQKAE